MDSNSRRHCQLDSNTRRHRQVGFQPLSVSSHLCYGWNPTDSMPRRRWNPTHTKAKESGIQIWLWRRALDSKSTVQRASWIPTHVLIIRLDSNSRRHRQVGFQPLCVSSHLCHSWNPTDSMPRRRWNPTHTKAKRSGIQLWLLRRALDSKLTVRRASWIPNYVLIIMLDSNSGYGGVSWIPRRVIGEQA